MTPNWGPNGPKFESGAESLGNLHFLSLCHLPHKNVRDVANFSVWVMGIWVCILSESAHLHMSPLHCTVNYDTGRYGMFTEKYVFGQHLIEPIASYLPSSLIYKQTTIQGHFGPKPKKKPREHFGRSGGSILYMRYNRVNHIIARMSNSDSN